MGAAHLRFGLSRERGPIGFISTFRNVRPMSALPPKADIGQTFQNVLMNPMGPSRGSSRTEDGPPPLSKCPTKAQCRFGLRSGSFSCHWDKPLVSSHPADSEILSSSLWLRAVVGVSLRVRHYKPERRLRTTRAEDIWGALSPLIVDDLRFHGITSVRAIATRVNERGILTPRGGSWHPTSAARLLSRLQS